MARLQILICTTAKGIRQLDIKQLPCMPDAEYIISIQNAAGADISNDITRLQRHDISTYEWADSGLSRNRNHAFDVATAPLLLIADDDLTFYPEGIAALIAAFDAEPDVDIITTRAALPEQRIYPADGHDLSRPFPHYSAISFEIALRRKVVMPVSVTANSNAGLRDGSHAAVRFNTRYGIGSGCYGCGEEDVFLHDAIAAGYKARYHDIRAVEHPGATTSVHSATHPDVVRAKGAVMRRLRGPFAAALRLPLEAHRSPLPTLAALRHLLHGYLHP